MTTFQKTLGVASVALGLMLSGCGANNTIKGTGIGAAAGAAIGAGIGKVAGNAGVGAIIGTAVGGAAGGIIGNRMDKQAKELEEQVPEATVEKVNNGEAIRVTFDSGILFPTNSSTLNSVSKEALTRFAENMNANPDTDIKIVGHTDNTGRHEYNMKLSKERALSVQNFLRSKSVASARMTSEGVGPDQPAVDNSTPENRAMNRRVEIFILPNAKMIQEAQEATK
ncbi:MAG: OmpA family protein [Porphyromonas sp.]|nr:OmpA family protein [Porphyromonas sp.]